MDQIDVVDQKGNKTNFGTRFLLTLDTSSLRQSPHSIESSLFYVQNKAGIKHEFILKINQVKKEEQIDYMLNIQFFCHMGDEAHDDLKYISAICDKYGKVIQRLNLLRWPVFLMSETTFESLYFKCNNRPLVLHLYILHHTAVFNKLLEITDTDETVCFSRSQLSPLNECQFLSDISKLYMNNDLGDFKILTKDNTFNVHKVVLAARSTVFAEYFKNNIETNTSEQCKNYSELSIDVSTEIVEEMLRYIYTDSVDKLDELALDLYEIGKQYNLADLLTKCVSSLCKKISVDNCMSLLHFAKKHEIDSLYNKVIDFFTKNTNDVLSNSATDEILKSFYNLELSLENPEMPEE